jgi:bis(5'-nucleosyl)-tetraphosphatase (symmetrical)
MSTYIIGDVHGCFGTLMHLMDEISYEPARDELCFVGDLVNNGPGSAEVLRFARTQSACVTLGNHDLHMLAVLSGAAKPRKKDTFQDVLDAPDVSTLQAWLTQQPMCVLRDDFWMVHAGLLPAWTREEIITCAEAIQDALRGPHPEMFFTDMYGNEPALWRQTDTPLERMRLGVNAMSRMRALHTKDGSLEFHYKSTLDEMPESLTPWFTHPHSRPTQPMLFFGHWSALGLHHDPLAQVWCLDSGCTWGHRLTAYRIDDHTLHSVPTVDGEAAQRG